MGGIPQGEVISVKFFQIKILEDEKSLKKHADASEIYIEITVFCKEDMVIKDTTWIKNIEQFAELIRFMDNKKLKKYTVNFLDNPIEIIFTKLNEYIEYEVRTFYGEFNCKIKKQNIKDDVIYEIEKALEEIQSKNERFMKDPFLQKIYRIIS